MNALASTNASSAVAPLLFLLAVGCRAAPHEACDVGGDWRANLVIYDGRAHLAVRDGDVLELELVGKGTQDAEGRRLDARHLTFELPSGDARCAISTDCKRIDCNAADGHRLFELTR